MKKRSLDGRAHLRGTWRRSLKNIMAATKEIAGLKKKMKNKVGKSFFQNEEGYGDGLKHQQGRNKGSLHIIKLCL